MRFFPFIIFSVCLACSAPNSEQSNFEKSVQKQEVTDFVLDDRGAKIALYPSRVLSLVPSHTEWIFALGAGAKLVGRTDQCDRPAEAQSVPSVGSLFPPDYERIVALQPDLVLMLDGQLQVRERLESLGLKTAVFSPNSVENTWDFASRLSKILGVDSDAVILSSKLKLTELQEKLPQDKPLILFDIWGEPLTVAGSNTFVSSMISLAGGQNLGDRVGEGWPHLSTEKLIELDPDVILSTSADAASRPGWSVLRAVREGRVQQIKDEALFLRPSPNIAIAVERLAEILHPEIFAPQPNENTESENSVK